MEDDYITVNQLNLNLKNDGEGTFEGIYFHKNTESNLIFKMCEKYYRNRSMNRTISQVAIPCVGKAMAKKIYARFEKMDMKRKSPEQLIMAEGIEI